MTQIGNAAEEYGDEAVANVIRDSMSSNYQGIMFDRLRKPAARGKNAPPSLEYSGRDDADKFLEMLREA